MTRPLAVWAAIVVPIWLVLVLCTHWEPIVRDSWGHLHWHRINPVTAGSVWAFAKGSYLHNNPRLGQVIALLLLTPGPWHAIATPVVVIALFVVLGALVLGRWPSPRSTSDARLVLSIAAIALATCPVVGSMLCYQPYAGNYLYPVALIVGFALPYRFHAETPCRRAWWMTPAMLVLGGLAGMCNEHVGVAIIAAIACALIGFVRRGDRLAPWMIAGLAGVVAGYAALLLAPGQAVRYDGLASQQTIVGLVAGRGGTGIARIVLGLVGHLVAALPWVTVAVVARRHDAVTRPRAIATWVIAGAALIATLALAGSPLLGDRLYTASTMLAAAAIAGWVHARTAGRAPRRASVALSVAALVVIGGRCLAAYHGLGPLGAARLDALEHARPGSTLVVAPFHVESSHWSVGDDLTNPIRRSQVARDFGLAGIVLAP